MILNVEELINSLGKTYKVIMEKGIIPYKTPPQGTKNDAFLILNMKKLGVFLSFTNDSEQELCEITLQLQKDQTGIKLPSSIQRKMTRELVHEHFGSPDKSIPPETLFKRSYGWRDRFTLKDRIPSTTMIVLFDTDEQAQDITFLPTSLLKW